MSERNRNNIGEPSSSIVDLASLQWREPTLDMWWQDGTQILAAVSVRDSRTGKAHWEYAVVTVHADVGRFELTVNDEYWGWEYDDIATFAVLSGEVCEREGCQQ